MCRIVRRDTNGEGWSYELWGPQTFKGILETVTACKKDSLSRPSPTLGVLVVGTCGAAAWPA